MFHKLKLPSRKCNYKKFCLTLLFGYCLFYLLSQWIVISSEFPLSPPALYCKKFGGHYIGPNESGSVWAGSGFCQLKDGRQCEEMHFYHNGKCVSKIMKDTKNIFNNKISKKDSFVHLKMTLYASTTCEDTSPIIVINQTYMDKGCSQEGCFDVCDKKFPDGTELVEGTTLNAIKVEGEGEIDLYELCAGPEGEDLLYWATIMPLDGCVRIHHWPAIGHIKFKKLLLKTTKITRPKKHIRTETDYNIVCSAESSTYFGIQVQTGYYSFLTSQGKDASYTRLLTSSELDDLGEIIPTFYAKRHPYSRQYIAINKVDIISKWYASAQPPQERVIVIIDPDNWLLQSLKPIVKQIKRGFAIANRAWFRSAIQMVTTVWKLLCENNCNSSLDLVSSPYFIHRDDLAIIAPLWKYYTIKIQEHKNHVELTNIYQNLHVSWCAEMYGYVFAAAHAGVKHEIKKNLQLKDIGRRPRRRQIPSILMLHIGKAWLSFKYELGKKWWHTDANEFSYLGAEVWCKSNITAADIIPWPIPLTADFQSNATLMLLHSTRKLFGPLPYNKYRKKPVDHSAYVASFP